MNWTRLQWYFFFKVAHDNPIDHPFCLQVRGQLYQVGNPGIVFLDGWSHQGSHRHWKTWKNETTFSSQGKVREFWKNVKKSGNFVTGKKWEPCLMKGGLPKRVTVKKKSCFAISFTALEYVHTPGTCINTVKPRIYDHLSVSSQNNGLEEMWLNQRIAIWVINIYLKDIQTHVVKLRWLLKRGSVKSRFCGHANLMWTKEAISKLFSVYVCAKHWL